MDAGRELDALVAEKVMGLPVVWATDPYTLPGKAPEGRKPFLKGNAGGVEYDWAEVRPCSTSLAAAWRVVEHFRSQWDEGDLTDHFWTFKDCGVGCGGWKAAIEVCPDHDGCAATHEATAPTLALAICLAALKAVGYEEA